MRYLCNKSIISWSVKNACIQTEILWIILWGRYWFTCTYVINEWIFMQKIERHRIRSLEYDSWVKLRTSWATNEPHWKLIKASMFTPYMYVYSWVYYLWHSSLIIHHSLSISIMLWHAAPSMARRNALIGCGSRSSLRLPLPGVVVNSSFLSAGDTQSCHPVSLRVTPLSPYPIPTQTRVANSSVFPPVHS